VQTRRLAASFDASTQVRNPYRSGDIPVQSHVRLGVFFLKIPEAAWCQSVNVQRFSENAFMVAIYVT